jgi:hypothetical protein
MYFAIRSSNYIMPETIHAFFLANFNILDFRRNNEYIIQDSYIKQYVSQSTVEELLPAVFDMLDIYSGREVYIHVDFPNALLVKIMRPYLLMYYQSTLSLDMGKRKYYQTKLIRELNVYFRNHPNFGRKKLSVESKIVYKEVNNTLCVQRKKNIIESFMGIDASRTNYDVSEFMHNHVYDNRIPEVHVLSRPRGGRVVRYGYPDANDHINGLDDSNYPMEMHYDEYSDMDSESSDDASR